MKPLTKSSIAQKLNEIRRLKRQIQQQRDQLRKEKHNFRRRQKLRSQKQLTNDYDMQDLLEDQQNLLLQTSLTFRQSHSHFNHFVYDLRVLNEMTSYQRGELRSDMEDQTQKNLVKKDDKKQENIKKNPIKRSNKNQNQSSGQNEMNKNLQQQFQKIQQSKKIQDYENNGLVFAEQNHNIFSQKDHPHEENKMQIEQHNEVALQIIKQKETIQQQKKLQNELEIDELLSLGNKEQQSHNNQNHNNQQNNFQRQNEPDITQEQMVDHQVVDDPIKLKEETNKYLFGNLSSKPINKTEYLNPEYYITRIFPFGQQGRYRQISAEEATEFKIPQHAFRGFKMSNFYQQKQDHQKIRLEMQEFVKYDWSKLRIANLNDCQLTTADWQLFCENSHLFQGLRLLSLTSNQIRSVKKQELKRFPNLKGINFCNKSSQFNRLSQQSIKQLTQYQQQNKRKIRIFFKPIRR